jgi:KDEL-tailed cysteine endopeptidase
MKNFFLAFALAIIVLAQNNYDFDQYIKDFGKTYISEEEYSYRKQIFDSKFKQIQESNSQNKGYTLSANQFTDRSDEELKGFLTQSVDPRIEPTPKSSGELKVNAPTSWDWREYSRVTPARVQGSCGSCWAFSAVAAFESLMAIKTGQKYDLSEEYVL